MPQGLIRCTANPHKKPPSLGWAQEITTMTTIVLQDSVEDAEIARDASHDANYSIYLASRAAAAIWPGAVAESTP